jgi:hypothetical protein
MDDSATPSQNLIITLMVEFILVIALLAYVFMTRNFSEGIVKYIIYFVLVFMIVIGALLVRDDNNTDFDVKMFIIDFMFIPGLTIIFITLKILYDLYVKKNSTGIVQAGGKRSR